ncbi:MAG TPA: hypothetical protein VF584_26580 [Longimicrobium sp.]|jgi:hypothetical protein
MNRFSRSVILLAYVAGIAGCTASKAPESTSGRADSAEHAPDALAAATLLPPCSTNCIDVAMKVVLDKIGGAVSNPDAQWFKRDNPQARPEYFLANLKTLADETQQVATISVKVSRDADIAKFILGAQALKWEVITTYLGTALEKTWTWTRWAGTGSQLILGVMTPTTGGYGAAFEFCDPSATPERVRQAQSYITTMLQTYEPASFRQVARRVDQGRKCANVMAAYLAMPRP